MEESNSWEGAEVKAGGKMNKENTIYDEETGEYICRGCGNIIEDCECEEEDFSEAGWNVLQDNFYRQ